MTDHEFWTDINIITWTQFGLELSTKTIWLGLGTKTTWLGFGMKTT